MSSDSPWPRRIVVCCDGTWQSSVTSEENIPSNVTKLARTIARIGTDANGKKYHQLVYYDSGIGTGALSDVEKSRQGGVGDGLAENVMEAYNFIVLNYQEGDEIFCFGFSRGAYTARAVAGLVTDIGVIHPADLNLLPAIYRAYKQNRDGNFKNTDAWKAFEKRHTFIIEKREEARKRIEGANYKPRKDEGLASEASRKVKVVGVWDTVGSLGVPDGRFSDNKGWREEHGFHNVRLSRRVEHAYHALALDERRKAFTPTLWYIDHEEVKKGGQLPELRQVWFPGFHINIGGGSDDGLKEMEGDLEGMANITFAWMLQCISPHLTLDLLTFQKHIVDYQAWLDVCQNACTLHHASQESIVTKGLHKVLGTHSTDDVPHDESQENWATRKLHEALGKHAKGDKTPPPHKHTIDRGWGTGPMPDSLTGALYTYAGEEKREPGHCKVEIWNPETKDYDSTPIHKIGISNEYIHPVTAYRIFHQQNSSSKAIPFEQKKHDIPGRKLVTVNGKGKEVKQFYWQKKTVSLPEWIILDKGEGFKQTDYERMWLVGGDGEVGDEQRWLETLDRELKGTFEVIRGASKEGKVDEYPGVLDREFKVIPKK